MKVGGKWQFSNYFDGANNRNGGVRNLFELVRVGAFIFMLKKPKTGVFPNIAYGGI